MSSRLRTTRFTVRRGLQLTLRICGDLGDGCILVRRRPAGYRKDGRVRGGNRTHYAVRHPADVQVSLDVVEHDGQ